MPQSAGMRFAVLTVVLALTSGFAPPAKAATVTCGQVLTASVSLSNDLTDCPDTILTIGADDIVVDLNGHRLEAIKREIRRPIDFQGHDGIVLRNGSVATLGAGLRIDGDHNVLRDMRVSAFLGGVLVSGDHNRISHSEILSSRSDGIAISGGEGNVVDHVRASVFGNATGISLADGSRNRVSASDGHGLVGISVLRERSSTVTQSGAIGGSVALSISASDGVVVSQTRAEAVQRGPRRPTASVTVADSVGAGVTLIGNRTRTPTDEGTLGFVIENNHGAGDRVLGNIARNKTVGFAISNGHGTVIRNNIAGRTSGRSGGRLGGEANLSGISVSEGSSDVVVKGNRANYNHFNGITVAATNSLVRRNVANFNGGNGISAGSGGVTFTQNIAAYNGGTGILAGPTDIDGGGNAAHHNGISNCTSPPLMC